MSETTVVEPEVTPEQKIEVQEQKYSARFIQTALHAIDRAIENGQKSAKVQIMDWSRLNSTPDWATLRIGFLMAGIDKVFRVKYHEEWRSQSEADVEPPAQIYRLDLVISW